MRNKITIEFNKSLKNKKSVHVSGLSSESVSLSLRKEGRKGGKETNNYLTQ